MKGINDIMIDKFQYLVLDLLVRNKSILDSLTKFQDSNARINRSIIKSVTHCGCIKISGTKQNFPEEGSLDSIQSSLQTHVEGSLCPNCMDIVEKEIGANLFYLAALCNALDLNLYDILIKEYDRLKMLGKYNLR